MRFRHSLAVSIAGMSAVLAGSACASSFSLIQTLDEPVPSSSALFGASVALDSGLVLVGAPQSPVGGDTVGRAHLFDAATGAFVRTFDDPTPVAGDSFGAAVALNGNLALIGAPEFGGGLTPPIVGQAHLFDVTTGALLHTFDDPTPTGGAFLGDFFGSAVALSGTTALIGAPGDNTAGNAIGQAHLFDTIGGGLLRTFDDPTVTMEDRFGTSVAIQGSQVLIGAPGDGTGGSDVGQAHLFDAITGAVLQTFDDPTPGGDDSFGIVAIDGNRVLIGAPGDGTQGASVGQAHLFDATTGAVLQTFDDPTVTAIDRFGTAVALDGDHVLIGALGDDTEGTNVGQAYLFDAVTGALLHTFDDPTTSFGIDFDNFGATLDVEGDLVAVGALFDSTNGAERGQAHVFKKDMAPIPLPASLPLLLGGLAAVFGVVRLRRRCG